MMENYEIRMRAMELAREANQYDAVNIADALRDAEAVYRWLKDGVQPSLAQAAEFRHA